MTHTDEHSGQSAGRERRARPPRFARIGLISVLVAAVGLQLVHLALDTLPMHWDPSRHSQLSLALARNATDRGFEAFVSRIYEFYAYYPPGFHLLTAPAYWIFGRSLDAGIAWQILYLLGTMLGLHRLVSRHANGQWGVLAALCYLCLPVVLGLGRMVYIENLMALEIVLLACLLDGPEIRRTWRGALAVGFVFGYGQLTKWNFVLLGGPLLLIAAIDDVRSRGLRGLRWVAAAVPVAAAIALPWYVIHFERLTTDVRRYSFGVADDFAPVLSWAGLSFYPESFATQMVWLPMSLLLAGAAVLSLLPRTGHPSARRWTLALVLSMALFSAAPHKQGRFIAPLLPLSVAVLVVQAARLKVRPRRLVTGVVISLSVLNAAAQTLDLGEEGFDRPVRLPDGAEAWWVRNGTPGWLLRPIVREDWPLDEVFADVAAAAYRTRRKRFSWWIEQDTPYFNYHVLASWAEAMRLSPSRRIAEADIIVACGRDAAQPPPEAVRAAGGVIEWTGGRPLPDGRWAWVGWRVRNRPGR